MRNHRVVARANRVLRDAHETASAIRGLRVQHPEQLEAVMRPSAVITAEIVSAKAILGALRAELRLAVNEETRQATANRRCKGCGKIIPKRYASSGAIMPPAAYAKRVYCGHACRSKITTVRKPRVEKVCESCGHPIPKRINGRLIPVEAWERRRFCNATCREAARAKPPTPKRVRKSKPKPTPKRRRSTGYLTAATVLRVVRDYRGLPLTPFEVIDHLGLASDNQKSKAAKFLRELEQLGEISVKDVDGKPAYFDQAAWAEAA